MAFTYTLTKNPGNLFRLSGSWILVNTTSIAQGKSYPVTMRIDDGRGAITFKNMVLSEGGGAPAVISATLATAEATNTANFAGRVSVSPPLTNPTLKFNQRYNSQYIGTLVGSV